MDPYSPPQKDITIKENNCCNYKPPKWWEELFALIFLFLICLLASKGLTQLCVEFGWLSQEFLDKINHK